MVLTALRGALGFLSQLPVGHSEAAWDAFVETPAAFPLAGYVVGALVALPFLTTAVLPAPVVAAAYLTMVVLVTGINHADGLADLGDAAVVHGDPDDRRAVMKDTTVGVGAVLALGSVLLALVLGALTMAALPPVVAVAAVVASEVGAKLAMATLACLGTPSHEGFGATMLAEKSATDLIGPLLVVLPATVIVVPVTTAAVVAGIAVALVLRWWADRRLGGIGGDVFGGANELARVTALHAAAVAWTLIDGNTVAWTLLDWGVFAWTLS